MRVGDAPLRVNLSGSPALWTGAPSVGVAPGTTSIAIDTGEEKYDYASLKGAVRKKKICGVGAWICMLMLLLVTVTIVVSVVVASSHHKKKMIKILKPVLETVGVTLPCEPGSGSGEVPTGCDD